MYTIYIYHVHKSPKKMMVSLKSSAFSHGCFDGFSHVFPDFKEGGLVQVKDFLPMDLAQDADFYDGARSLLGPV
jgi:hypothetical protein